jgi:glycosyltransferase involved in cell wall biosynthesis
VIDTALFDPAMYDREEIRTRLGLQGKKVISYMCSLDWGGSRDLDTILSAVQQVEQKRSDIVLLIIGGGILQERFQKMAADLKIKAVSFTGLIPHETVPEYLAASDLALIYMRDDPGNQTRFSLKLLEYLCMGKTVVGNLAGATKEALGEYCVLSTERIEDFADTIMRTLNTPPGAKDARKHIVDHHDWQVVKQSIQAALAELEP